MYNKYIRCMYIEMHSLLHEVYISRFVIFVYIFNEDTSFLRENTRSLARACTRNNVLKSRRSSKGIYLQTCYTSTELAVAAFEGTSRQPPLKRNIGGTVSFPHVQLALQRTKYQFYRRKASHSTYIYRVQICIRKREFSNVFARWSYY